MTTGTDLALDILELLPKDHDGNYRNARIREIARQVKTLTLTSMEYKFLKLEAMQWSEFWKLEAERRARYYQQQHL